MKAPRSPAHATTFVCLDRSGGPASRDGADRLDEAERRRATELSNDRVRDEYLRARRLQRLSLSHGSGVDPADWRFALAPGGRPEVVEPRAFRSLRFSITHTLGLIACAVAWDTPVGVDAEALDRPVEADAVARRFFAPDEAASLAALPPDVRRRRFLEHWTLKEACFKALGTGLATPLDALRLTLGDGCVAAHFAPETGEHARDWQFELHAPSSRHVLALALRTRARGRRTEFVTLDGEA